MEMRQSNSDDFLSRCDGLLLIGLLSQRTAVERLTERTPPGETVEYENENDDDPEPDAIALFHRPPKVHPARRDL